MRPSLRAVTGLLLAASSACSGEDGGRRSPTAPSAVVAEISSAATRLLLPPPGVAGPSAVEFPPRDETLRFRQALETEYRDVLRRGLTSTFVDMEGTIVWTQEYLRYRAGACTPSTSQAHVFAQIEGRGLPPICSTVGPGIQGVWDGVYQRGGTFVLWVGANDARYTGSNQDITDYPTGVSNTGNTYTFDLYFGDTGIQLVAFWDGAHTMQGTTRGMGLGNFTMVRRR